MAVVVVWAGGIACGNNSGSEPGTELGPCEAGWICRSPLRCVDEICVHPDQLGSSGEGEDDAGEVAATAMGTASATTMPDPADGTSGSMTAGMGEASSGASGMTDATSTAGSMDGSMDGGEGASATADATAGDCVPPECGAYAAKMGSCYPLLGLDWYAECLEIADICNFDGGCFTPMGISCSLAMPCDAVVDGACIDDAC